MSKLHSHWVSLNDLEQLKELDRRSFDQPVVIFKHSTRCGVSTYAERRLLNGWDGLRDTVRFYHLDLLAHRNISNEIAKKYGIIHQSPQILVVKNGDVISHSSHDQVDVDFIRNSLNQRVRTL